MAVSENDRQKASLRWPRGAAVPELEGPDMNVCTVVACSDSLRRSELAAALSLLLGVCPGCEGSHETQENPSAGSAGGVGGDGVAATSPEPALL